MNKYFIFCCLIAIFSTMVFARNVDSDPASLELAKTTLAAHGGDKLKAVKNMVIKGTADVTGPGTAQSIPAGFAFVFSGEKYRFDLQSPFFSFKQVSDGVNTSSSMPGIVLPPMNRAGLTLLTKIEDTGYVVSALSEKLKKKKGFRITTPEGYFADFVVDDKTAMVKEFESSYEVNGRTYTTSVAIDSYKDLGGIKVNERFSQRLDMGQFTSYASFKATEILIDTEISDDVFTMN